MATAAAGHVPRQAHQQEPKQAQTRRQREQRSSQRNARRQGWPQAHEEHAQQQARSSHGRGGGRGASVAACMAAGRAGSGAGAQTQAGATAASSLTHSSFAVIAGFGHVPAAPLGRPSPFNAGCSCTPPAIFRDCLGSGKIITCTCARNKHFSKGIRRRKFCHRQQHEAQAATPSSLGAGNNNAILRVFMAQLDRRLYGAPYGPCAVLCTSAYAHPGMQIVLRVLKFCFSLTPLFLSCNAFHKNSTPVRK